jgi:tRNA uridine 5-carboxymethylaminomethyl modification enzyme
MGLRVALLSMNLDTIGQLSCNPAIGGLAKGHLVREIDALGGVMGRVSDMACIQSRLLNRSKGPAVWSLRHQVDRGLYKSHLRQLLEAQEGLDILQAQVEGLLVEGRQVKGVKTTLGGELRARAVVLTTGTFLRGLIHVGLQSQEAGRAGEPPAVALSEALRRLGLKLGRLKTGTPPRLDARSIDFSACQVQEPELPPVPFSSSTEAISNPQLPCYITYTTAETREIILRNLDRSPLYSGRIQGIGPRYCPSIEDKVVRFAHRQRHQVFLEPEGLRCREYYANGVSTSLPLDVQVALVRSIPGLQEARLMRPGYAVEYDFVLPTQLEPTLECKLLKGLFLAGQINGTSGYEEAAAQGLVAGANAALVVLGRKPLLLGRDEAYIGVLIDDLVSRGTTEPYRMFTSRAEFRLLLRHDNAEMRLSERAYEAGLIGQHRYGQFLKKRRWLQEELRRLRRVRLRPGEVNPLLQRLGSSPVKEAIALEQLLRRPEVSYQHIITLSAPEEPPPSEELKGLVETEVKYAGYIQRQREAARRLRAAEARPLPQGLDYMAIPGLSRELAEKLQEVRPSTLGQASRIQGMTPAALSLLEVAARRHSKAPHGP